MKEYIVHDEWSIIEEGFRPEWNKVSESIFSIGNGKFGQRANFEEYFSGSTLEGNYISGIYYPDKTKVGWWKNGYPEYFAKVLNAPNWTGVKCSLNGEKLDLAKVKVSNFKSELNMREGLLGKQLRVELSEGAILDIESERFVSMHSDEVAAMQYILSSVNASGQLEIILDIDGDISNADSNYEEKFWNLIDSSAEQAYLCMETKKTAFRVAEGLRLALEHNGNPVDIQAATVIEEDKRIGYKFTINISPGDKIRIHKFVSVCSSLYYDSDNLIQACITTVDQAAESGYLDLLEDHKLEWARKWEEGDIKIDGDLKAQQGIRFNIFQLHQTYSGRDKRLNIGPKGLTGEKYGGSTYWDTEAYCLPFYMSTAPKEVSLNLLKYRYAQLDKAIENAEKLGFKNGAALYPMVTMNGEECHNEWEITFEEIHRNGAIAYAIFNYIRYFDDHRYLWEGGLEVLLAISRFWYQRANFSSEKNQYVILGVTGPNEYENNVNNNWYTNRIASWCLEYTLECIDLLRDEDKARLESLLSANDFTNAEGEEWNKLIRNMYYPEDETRGIFLQQDGFFDKEIAPIANIPIEERPIHEHWSWDRILRSCYIKQADVLQGLWFLEHLYSVEELKRNFDFYEPLTVHESSLSSCIHSIQAGLIGDHDKAYQFYLNSSRLDLDDYNNDTCDGLHITSMGGTWMTIVYGFAGMRIKNNKLYFNPQLPKDWESLSFNMLFRGAKLSISLGKESMEIINSSDRDVLFMLGEKEFKSEAGNKMIVTYA